jgi:hypothetical protein
MYLDAFHGEFGEIVRIRGAKEEEEEILEGVYDSMPPPVFDDDDYTEGVFEAVRKIVLALPSDDGRLGLLGDAAAYIYGAYGQWADPPQVEVTEADLAACIRALAERGLAGKVRALDWSRGSPLLPAVFDESPRFSFMAPEELATCSSCMRNEDWSSLPAGAQQLAATLTEWIEQAGAGEGLGLFLTLWEGQRQEGPSAVL